MSRPQSLVISTNTGYEIYCYWQNRHGPWHHSLTQTKYHHSSLSLLSPPSLLSFLLIHYLSFPNHVSLYLCSPTLLLTWPLIFHLLNNVSSNTNILSLRLSWNVASVSVWMLSWIWMNELQLPSLNFSVPISFPHRYVHTPAHVMRMQICSSSFPNVQHHSMN